MADATLITALHSLISLAAIWTLVFVLPWR